MQYAKKKDPSSQQALSASGIDFLYKLLEVESAKRLNAVDALKHHWFINFTNKTGSTNKKL